MIKEIKMYETPDGKAFSNKGRAQEHVRKLTLEKKYDNIDGLFARDSRVDFDDLCNFLKENRELVCELLDVV